MINDPLSNEGAAHLRLFQVLGIRRVLDGSFGRYNFNHQCLQRWQGPLFAPLSNCKKDLMSDDLAGPCWFKKGLTLISTVLRLRADDKRLDVGIPAGGSEHVLERNDFILQPRFEDIEELADLLYPTVQGLEDFAIGLGLEERVVYRTSVSNEILNEGSTVKIYLLHRR